MAQDAGQSGYQPLLERYGLRSTVPQDHWSIPPEMERNWLYKWCRDILDRKLLNLYQHEEEVDGLVIRAEGIALARSLGIELPEISEFSYDGIMRRELSVDPVSVIMSHADNDSRGLLQIADYLLNSQLASTKDAKGLDLLLRGSRSTWMVAPSQDEIIQRLPEETRKSLEEATSSGRAPAKHLADAWRDGFSREPNATSAYLSGVMAIESAIRSIVSPKKEGATLGTMINEIKDKPSKWRTRFDNDTLSGIVGLEGVLRAIWEAHVRHGSDEYASVTLEQARDVCQVALLVVSLVDSRGFERTKD